MKPTILYLEDDPDLQELTALWLDDAFDLVLCASGDEALALAPMLTPDLLLLDVVMPGLDGPATWVRLRELPHLAQVPAVFLTGRGDAAGVAALMALGASDVLTKPCEPTTLLARLKAALALA